MPAIAQQSASANTKKPIYGFFLCATYILISAGLINFNKYLMHKDRFPHAMCLTFFHMTASTVCCVSLYLIRPSLFPAMTSTEGKRSQLVKWFVPLGILFAVGLFFSNEAYLYCSVAFLQFMKEGNVVLVFLLSCLAGLQMMDRLKAFIIFWIIAGASMAVEGEINFVWYGFFIQLLSQFGECGKNVMGEYLLSGSNLKLDPLTYTMFMAPVCLVVLTIGNYLTWNTEIIPDAMDWWHLLLPNAMLAFALNVCIAVLIKECSAMGFILSGLVKDMFIVSVSTYLFGDVIVTQQMIGFSVCLSGIFAWSYMKMDPNSLVISTISRILGMPNTAEAKPLMTTIADEGKTATKV